MKEKLNWYKTLLVTKPITAILLFLVPIGLIGYFIYNFGKNKGLNTPPSDAPSPEYQPPTAQEKAIFEEWTKTTGKVIVEQAHSYFTAWYSKVWYGEMRDLCHTLKELTDKELIWIANDYNRKYFKDGTFLTQIIEHKIYATASYDSVLARLTKLKAK